jgi:hypothetical protein
MLKRFVKRTSVLFILLVPLGGCLDALDSVDILPNKANRETINCLVDGVPFEATSGKGLLAVDFVKTEMQQDENSFLLTVFGVNMQDNGEALAVGFRLGGRNIGEIQPGDTFTEWVPIEDAEGPFEGAMGGVEKRKSATSEEYIFKAGSNHTGEISLTVTAIDLAERRISGTFQFTAQDVENDILLNVTEGDFENIQWEVE